MEVSMAPPSPLSDGLDAVDSFQSHQPHPTPAAIHPPAPNKAHPYGKPSPGIREVFYEAQSLLLAPCHAAGASPLPASLFPQPSFPGNAELQLPATSRAAPVGAEATLALIGPLIRGIIGFLY